MLLLLLTLCVVRELVAFEVGRTKTPNGYNVRVGGVGPIVAGFGHSSPADGGNNRLNMFGILFQQQGFVWTKQLCNTDSDGDGRSNGEELGDPNCVWTIGDIPERLYDITHPGVADSAGQTVDMPHIIDFMSGPLGFHIGLMIFSWLILVPIATLPTLIYDDNHKAQTLHLCAMICALILTLIGFCMAIYYMDSSHFSTAHGKLGLTIVILAVIMGMSGFMRPRRNAVGEPKTAQYTVWSWAHPMLGRMLIVAAVVDIYLGWNNLGADLVPLYVFIAILGFGFLLRAIFFIRARTQQA